MKRGPRRDMNPNNKRNWVLVCSVCGAEFANDESISLDGEASHFEAEHPDLETPAFNLVWVGIGPKPRSRH